MDIWFFYRKWPHLLVGQEKKSSDCSFNKLYAQSAVVVGSEPGAEAAAVVSPGLVDGLSECERDQNKTEEDQEGRIDLWPRL